MRFALRRRLLAAGLLAALAVAALATAVPTLGVNGAVAITPTGFVPDTVTIDAGESVVWTNQDGVNHQLSFDGMARSSGQIKPGQTFTGIFGSPGTYRYAERESGWRGTVIVRAVATPTPPVTPTPDPTSRPSATPAPTARPTAAPTPKPTAAASASASAEATASTEPAATDGTTGGSATDGTSGAAGLGGLDDLGTNGGTDPFTLLIGALILIGGAIAVLALAAPRRRAGAVAAAGSPAPAPGVPGASAPEGSAQGTFGRGGRAPTYVVPGPIDEDAPLAVSRGEELTEDDVVTPPPPPAPIAEDLPPPDWLPKDDGGRAK